MQPAIARNTWSEMKLKYNAQPAMYGLQGTVCNAQFTMHLEIQTARQLAVQLAPFRLQPCLQCTTCNAFCTDSPRTPSGAPQTQPHAFAQCPFGGWKSKLAQLLQQQSTGGTARSQPTAEQLLTEVCTLLKHFNYVPKGVEQNLTRNCASSRILNILS